MVHARVDAALSASRTQYPNDAQVYPSGGANCRPFSSAQLDCTQVVRDLSDPWTGTSMWRATVDPSSGAVTIVEHGGATLEEMLNQRSAVIGGR